MPPSLMDRLAAMEARRHPLQNVLVVNMPEWRLPTVAEQEAWKAEHVAPLESKARLVVVIRDFDPPAEEHAPGHAQ